MQDFYLTPHFKLSEMCASRKAEELGIANVPPPEAVENLRRLCIGTLEPLREALGLPVIITSGYRCKQLNDIIVHANKRGSQHLYGMAADFYLGGQDSILNHRQLLVMAFRMIISNGSIDFDQVIIYPTFIHVSYVSKEKNRHKLTEANGSGRYRNLTRADAFALY